MKKIILTLAGLIFLLNAFSQKQNTIPENMVFIPSKTEGVSIQAFYMSNEITNKEYRAYTDYVSLHVNDSLCWNEPDMKTICKKYSVIAKDMIDPTIESKKVIDSDPVVGVSYKQADLYCKWRTYIDSKESKNKSSAQFRLPTEEEWEYALVLNKPEILKGTVSEWTSSNDKNSTTMKIVRGGSSKKNEDGKQRISIDENAKENYIGFRIVQSYLGRE